MSDTVLSPPTGKTMTREAAAPDREAVSPPLVGDEDDCLANHPLWPAFLAELEASRRADKEQSAAEYAA